MDPADRGQCAYCIVEVILASSLSKRICNQGNKDTNVKTGSRKAWNKAKLIGPKPPLQPKHVWAIRIHFATTPAPQTAAKAPASQALQPQSPQRGLDPFPWTPFSQLIGCPRKRVKPSMSDSSPKASEIASQGAPPEIVGYTADLGCGKTPRFTKGF
jgi:hypothetical protein